MAIVIKVRKRALEKIGLRGGRETSTLRPRYTPKTPPCSFTCPSATDIRGYLTTIAQSEFYGWKYEESFEKAWYILTDKNPFPAVCGRVCPHPCENECNRKEKDAAVSINTLERFIGDYGIKNNLKHKKITEDFYPEKIAVIGAGPSGFSCAYQLARRGYSVTVFEEFDKPGGMLRYGIPSYRLPEDILDAEINAILNLGIQLKCRTKVTSLDQLKKKYNAIYVAIGAHKGLALGIPGEEAENVFSAVEYLHKTNSGQKVEIGNKVLVIGGGNSAIDSARVAKRSGVEVTILYRRTKVEMPAIEDEVIQAEEEEIQIELLTAPVEVLKDRNNKVTGLKCIRMELGEPDESGRRRPVPIKGSEFELPATSIIVAISQISIFNGLNELKNKKGWITVDERGKTAKEGIFAGGDVTQLGLVTEAIGQGRKAAEAIDEYLRQREPAKVDVPIVIRHTKMNLNYYDTLPRTQIISLAPAQRIYNFNEVSSTIDTSQAIAEAKRCLSCGQCYDCENCYTLCSDSAVKRLPKGQHFEFNLALCQGCKKCAQECPCGYIDMI